MADTGIYLHCDFHVHTRYSPCAWPEMLPKDIVDRARERGVKYLGLTDHVFGFTDPAILKCVRQDCSPRDGDPEVFFGCEADVMSVGSTTVTPEMIDTLDYIMVAANHFANDWQKMVEMPISNDPEVVGRHFLKMFNYAATLDYADVIVHPFYVMPGSFDVAAIYTLTEKDLIPGIESAAANGIAVEISRRSITPEHIDFLTPFYRLCKEAGVKFSVGSDSHRLEDVGRTDVLTPLIRELGLQDEDFWIPKKNGGKKE
jgi:histidinol phosphatase-like PHP family hydrolase